MTEFHGGAVPTGREVWTATVGVEDVGYEEIDVIVPLFSEPATIRATVQAVLDDGYLPGLPIVDVTPFRGVAVWSAR